MRNANGRRIDFASIAVAICAAFFCGFVVWFPLTDSDIWWHLAAGREMIRRRALLFADPFSFTPVDARWINIHWLFQLAAFAVHQAAGVRGLIAAKCFFVALTAATLVLAIPARAGRLVAAVVVCALIFEARYLALIRPTVISTLFIAISLLCWERYRAGCSRAWLWLLAPVQIAWVNVQGLFMLGPAIAAAYTVGDGVTGMLAKRAMRKGEAADAAFGARTWLVGAAIAVALIAASLVNPYGWRGVLLPLRLLDRIDPRAGNVFSHNISENAPLLSLFSSNPRYVAVVLGSAALCGVLLIISGKRASLSHAILFAGFFFLAVRAERNILLYCLIASFIIGTLAPAAIFADWRIRRAAAAAAAALLVADAAIHARLLAVCPKHEDISPFRFPAEAVDYLEKTPVAGNIFNADRYGGYLLWRLYPPRRVFIDGRFILRSAGFFSDYLKILDYPSLFPFAVEKFGITQALLQTAIFPRYMPLARALYHDSAWTLAYADGATALYILKACAPAAGIRLDEAATVDSIAASLEKRWRDDPLIRREALAHLAAFLQNIGEYASARLIHRRLGSLNP